MTHATSDERRPVTGRDVEVRLIGHFAVRRGGLPVEVPPAARPLVGHLALREAGCDRSRVAAELWPDLPAGTGLVRLRNALYRLGSLDDALVRVSGARLTLGDHVHVDVRRARRLAEQVLGRAGGVSGVVPSSLFSADLVPDWDEEWVVADREDFARVRVRVLEQLARDAMDTGRYHDAERACRAVTEVEPYRETAHRLLAEVYLAEGNAAQALQQLVAFQRRLHRDLGVAAGEDLRRLAGSIRAAAA